MIKQVRSPFLIVLGVLATLRVASPLTMTAVSGHSMEPTLRPGGWYLLDRGYFRSHTLERGDIVVLRHRGETYVKRIHALPGEKVWLLRSDDGGDDLILDPWEVARFQKARTGGLLPGHRMISMTVPPGYSYVLGDNTLNSIDSRRLGPVPIESIIGRVTP